MFEITESFREAMVLANRLPDDRFPLLLERIISKAHVKEGAIFTAAELKRLQRVVGLAPAELETFLEACKDTVRRAATENVSEAALGAVLNEAGVAAFKVATFQEVWQVNGEDLVQRLKEWPVETSRYSQVASVDWRCHLQVASSEAGRKLEPMGILQLQLQPASEVAGLSGDKPQRKVAMEFTYDELCAYFEMLERIQEELDSLS